MSDWQDKVRAFRDRMGFPRQDTPALRDTTLCARIIAEEAAETVAALVGTDAAHEILQTYARRELGRKTAPNLPGTIDGLCDTIYVCLSVAEALGIDLAPFIEEVHRTNMLKDPVIVDAVGKRGGKPPGWERPKIAEMLEELLEHETLVKYSRRVLNEVPE